MILSIDTCLGASSVAVLDGERVWPPAASR
jgi:tRNA A37 threonylcarbamoyladenosine modification protein TsaB